MNKLKKFLLGLGIICSLGRISKAENIELKAPEVDKISSVTIGKDDRRLQTEPITYVTVPVTSNAHQNALDLETAGATPSSGKLIVNLPNAEYDKNGIDGIRLNFRNNVHYRATSSPIPTLIGRINDFPSTGAFMRDELGLGSSITLENLTFFALRDEPFQYLELKSNNHIVKNCYFRATNNNRGITISVAGTGSSLTIQRCLFTSFSYGAEIGRAGSKWRGNIFKNCDSGFIGTAGADYGTTSSPGNNLFYKNRTRIAEIYAGTGYPLQWGWFYNRDGTQLTRLEDIVALIKDWRTTPTPSPLIGISGKGKPRKMDVGSDVLIEPFYRTPHPLIPVPAAAQHWELYSLLIPDNQSDHQLIQPKDELVIAQRQPIVIASKPHLTTPLYAVNGGFVNHLDFIPLKSGLSLHYSRFAQMYSAEAERVTGKKLIVFEYNPQRGQK